MFKINYIKSSFKTTPPQADFLEENFKSLSNIKIGCFDFHEKIKVTLMGSCFNFVNVTGIRSLRSLKEFYQFYLKISKTQGVSDARIDSISATYRFVKKSNVSLNVFRKKLCENQLDVKDNSKFPGITVRNTVKPGGGCAVYFRSGALNFIGFKHVCDMLEMKDLISKCMYV